ncbi:MAG: tetratricopeptide repeat protein [Asgard group archaeon]|nr:tetratricopeptide repeat protein [Asgard group archaeon]
MEKIERIQPFFFRKDREYEPFIQFLEKIITDLDPNFIFINKLIFEDRIDTPYVSLKIIKRIGSNNQGMEITIEEIYKQVDYGIIIDRVFIRPYGLRDDLKIEIESTRQETDPPYIEIRIIGPNDIIDKIIEQFRFQFKRKPIEEEKLNRELIMLKTMIKRKAWYIVETRAKNILEKHPNQIQALFAYAIARAAQSDLDTGEDLLLKVLQQQPDHNDALFNLGVIYKQKRENQKALEVLRKSILINPQNHSALCILGQINEEIGDIKEALNAYQHASQLTPNPNGFGYIGLDFSREVKEAIKRLTE